MMAQSRASPSSSPMRRPSGSGSIGTASPMPERPQSVENPLTPRNSSSRPHTPSSVGVCQNLDGSSGQMPQHSSPMDSHHYGNPESCGIANMGSPQSHYLQSYLTNMPGDNQLTQQNHQPNQDFSSLTGRPSNSVSNNNGGGGGGKNIQVLPFPVFSWFDGPFKMGLKGGNPVSVVTEHTQPSTNVSTDHPPTNTNQDPGISTITQVSQNSQGVPSTNSSASIPQDLGTVEDRNTNSSIGSETTTDNHRPENSTPLTVGSSAAKSTSCVEPSVEKHVDTSSYTAPLQTASLSSNSDRNISTVNAKAEPVDQGMSKELVPNLSIILKTVTSFDNLIIILS